EPSQRLALHREPSRHSRAGGSQRIGVGTRMASVQSYRDTRSARFAARYSPVLFLKHDAESAGPSRGDESSAADRRAACNIKGLQWLITTRCLSTPPIPKRHGWSSRAAA